MAKTNENIYVQILLFNQFETFLYGFISLSEMEENEKKEQTNKNIKRKKHTDKEFFTVIQLVPSKCKKKNALAAKSSNRMKNH